MAIEYVPYERIDKKRWDACIRSAENGLIYGYSFYLDAMAAHWDALVMGDYEAVMPLTWKKKYSIRYLYQPYFTASLGVFGNNLSAGILAAFLQKIPAQFKYWDICFNHGNYFEPEGFRLFERMNYVLPLQETYESLYQHFRDNIKRNIKKAEKLQCVPRKELPVEAVIAVAREQSKEFASINDADFDRFKKLFGQLKEAGQALTYGVYSPGEELLSAAVFFLDDKRAYYILVGNHPNSKAFGASHALIHAFIKDHAGTKLLLDFEGSDISSLAFFYSSFGAREEKYPAIRLNRLPPLLRLFKK